MDRFNQNRLAGAVFRGGDPRFIAVCECRDSRFPSIRPARGSKRYCVMLTAPEGAPWRKRGRSRRFWLRISSDTAGSPALARLRALRSDLLDPTIAVHHGRVVKHTGDGDVIEFRGVVDAVRCTIELQNGMAERNAGLRPSAASSSESAFILAMSSRKSDGEPSARPTSRSMKG
jgi:hypothetical protein